MYLCSVKLAVCGVQDPFDAASVPVVGSTFRPLFLKLLVADLRGSSDRAAETKVILSGLSSG